jgi:hypothetical protein
VLDVGLTVKGETFQEETFTISVSQHGALLLLSHKVAIGQPLVLVNPATGQEIECHVVRFGSPHGGLSLVGIDFVEQSKAFWPW